MLLHTWSCVVCLWFCSQRMTRQCATSCPYGLVIAALIFPLQMFFFDIPRSLDAQECLLPKLVHIYRTWEWKHIRKDTSVDLTGHSAPIPPLRLVTDYTEEKCDGNSRGFPKCTPQKKDGVRFRTSTTFQNQWVWETLNETKLNRYLYPQGLLYSNRYR